MNQSIEPTDLARENAYLRQRNEELQGYVTSLSADVARLQQMLERTYGRTPGQGLPDPLSGGQS